VALRVAGASDVACRSFPSPAGTALLPPHPAARTKEQWHVVKQAHDKEANGVYLKIKDTPPILEEDNI